jgi:hypothetical protein
MDFLQRPCPARTALSPSQISRAILRHRPSYAGGDPPVARSVFRAGPSDRAISLPKPTAEPIKPKYQPMEAIVAAVFRAGPEILSAIAPPRNATEMALKVALAP